MYRFPGIEGWARLAAVMPKDFIATVDAERAAMDVWINLWLIGVVLAGEYIVLLLCTGRVVHPWFPFAAALLSFVAFRKARSAAESWGMWIRATYDLYLPALAKKLGFKLPPEIDGQRKLWATWWLAVRRRDLRAMQRLDAFREVPPGHDEEPEDNNGDDRPAEEDETDDDG
jgi:hypothetical protein